MPIKLFFIIVVFASFMSCGRADEATVVNNTDMATIDFAVLELKTSMSQYKSTDPFTVEVFSDTSLAEQAFVIEKSAHDKIVVRGGGRLGTMYGVLELSEQLALYGSWDSVEAKESAPFIEKRWGLGGLGGLGSEYQDKINRKIENILRQGIPCSRS